MTESPDLPEDEQELLEAFARLAPEGSAEWNFENSMRRLSTPAERPTWVGPWSGLPADLWERGRATKASERVMGDVIKVVAQDLTDYTQQAVDELRRFVPEASAPRYSQSAQFGMLQPISPARHATAQRICT